MNKFRLTINVLAVAIFALTFASVAQAQATRTWVSGVGDDANPCSRTAPCKTYAGAISKTARDGEISTLDPGGYGQVTITKSITINGGGTGAGYGSILATGFTQAVLINITDAADTRKSVRLDWLNLNGSSTGIHGIRMLAGNALHVENTIIDGFTTNGIVLDYTAANMAVQLSVHNTTIRNITGSGIRTNMVNGGRITTAISNVQITRCTLGIDQANATFGYIYDTVISLGTNGAQTAEPTSGSVMNMYNVTISNNSGVGITVLGGSRARIARCNIMQNGGASLTPAASVDSGVNNNIVGNTPNTAPAGTPFAEN